MKAVVFERYGPPEVLSLTDIAKPIPNKHEVLVRIHATSVTAEEPKMRGFHHPPLLKIPVGLMFGFRKPKRPVLGMEFSGVVERVGVAVTTYQPGDEVFGYTGLSFGAHAEYKCLPENALMDTKPRNMSFEEAATLVNGPLSALVYLHKKAHIQLGQRVLIYGASGAVGTAAVQLARYFGAKVTAVCSGKNTTLVQSLGADRVVDYTHEDFTRTTEKYDLIFDTVGKTSLRQCMNLLSSGGKYLCTEFGVSHLAAAIFLPLFGKKRVIIAASNMHWTKGDLHFLKELGEAGHLRSVIDRFFPLEAMREAHAYVQTGRKVGNVAIRITTAHPTDA